MEFINGSVLEQSDLASATENGFYSYKITLINYYFNTVLIVTH